MEKFNPIIDKYAKIDLSGRKALAEAESSIREFPGFSEELKKNFSSVLTFSDDSEKQVRERVMEKLHLIGERAGIGFIEAGADYPLHATLQEGTSSEDEQSREDTFRVLKEDEKLTQSLDKLKGLQLAFKYILLDRGNVLLTATDIPEEIVSIRGELEKTYGNAGLESRPLKNILHISLARMKETPKGADAQSRFAEYKKAMIQLRHEISSNPIKLDVRAVARDQTYRFLTGKG